MLDETTPADEQATPATPDATEVAPAEEAPAPARKTAAKKTTAKKTAAKKTTTRKTAARKTAAAEVPPTEPVEAPVAEESPAPAKKTAAKRTRKAPAKKAAAAEVTPEVTPEAVEAVEAADVPAVDAPAEEAPAPAKKAAAKKTTARKTAAKKTTTRKTAAKKTAAAEVAATETAGAADAPAADRTPAEQADAVEADASGVVPLFQAPEPAKKAPARRTRKRAAAPEEPAEAVEEEAEAADAAAAEVEAVDGAEATEAAETSEAGEADATEETAQAEGEESSEESTEDEETSDEASEGSPARRRRRRGGRRRRRSGSQNEQGEGEEDGDDASAETEQAAGDSAEGESDEAKGDAESSETGDDSEDGSNSSRRRRRRRRSTDTDADAGDDPENTVVRVRKARSAEDQITAVSGSTRLEAKKQRRREGREAGRRRAPIVSEAEFLARREAVDRVMVIRQRNDLTQIAVLEDKVLVEHYVARESQTSLIGNVYLGRVQNVLPSMEAAFVDIGKGRNAVLYAGEVNWSALGHKDGQPRKIESVLSPGQHILVQVTKDPIGHKGARLTSQVSLAGRFLVYVPDGTTSGISRKLPDTERARLKALLKEIVPDTAGVIVRTAAEGASEEELTADVERLKARWEDIEAKKSRSNGPTLLYGEPDLTLKVVRDLFTEDFSKLVIEGEDAWQTVQGYVEHVAPDLADRLEKYEPADNASAQQGDVFSVYRIEEQIAKGLDRKVWLPSGGSLVIDRTEAMTVVDVNTGKFTGSGGNLEETVTKNNLEAAEEIVRQLRLRDIGGIIVVDFIDMVLEANRDLVVRRLVECLGRDRTRHQVAEVTSLGLVQMTRKRIGTGLLETFGTDCEHCHGRGLITHSHPVESRGGGDDEGRRGRRARGKGGDQRNNDQKSNDQRNGGSEKSGKDDTSAEERSESGRGRNRRGGGRNAEQQAPAESVPSPILVAEKAREHATEHAAATGTPAPEAPAAPEQASEAKAAPAVAPTSEPAVEAAPEVSSAPEPTEPAAEAQKPKVVTRTRTRRGVSRPTTSTTTEAVALTIPVAEAPAAPVQDAPATPAPKVTVRTRGRAATRPAVPSEGDASGAEDQAAEPTVEHVPVKKKGARKR